MSWAANNPEAYEECERAAVVEMLTRDLKAEGLEDFDSDTLDNVVYILQLARRKAFDELVVKAQVGEWEAEKRGFAYSPTGEGA